DAAACCAVAEGLCAAGCRWHRLGWRSCARMRRSRGARATVALCRFAAPHCGVCRSRPWSDWPTTCCCLPASNHVDRRPVAGTSIRETLGRPVVAAPLAVPIFVSVDDHFLITGYELTAARPAVVEVELGVSAAMNVLETF